MDIVTTGIPYRSPESCAGNAYMQERCTLDVRRPGEGADLPVLVWFHGGGLRAGNNAIPVPLREKGVVVVSPNYRLYPTAKCPDYLDDAAAAVHWVFANIADYGGSPERIFLTGHSAGAYLAAMVGLDKRWLAKYGADADKLAGIIPLSAQVITHLTIRQERGIPPKTAVIDEFAPIYHARPDAPPLLLITGDRNLETLGRYEENAYLMRMMLVNGHKDTTLYEIQGYPHNMIEPACPIVLKKIKEQKIAP